MSDELEVIASPDNVEVDAPSAGDLAVEEVKNVTFKIVEDYEEGNETVMVLFTCQDTNKTLERPVKVCFDADGDYDAEATLIRIGEVRDGTSVKFESNVLQISAE